MSRLSPLPPNMRRSGSRASIAESDTTYHSFQDIDLELYEPPSPPRPAIMAKHALPTSTAMRRQDSGYESLPPRNSQSSRRRASTASSSSGPRPRPSTRRSTKGSTSGLAHGRSSGQSLYLTRSQPHHATQYFHFPSPHPTTMAIAAQEAENRPQSPLYIPPQTTHYWTSDRTRRLEYAAIDAASRGVKGWVMRHLPDCLAPGANRHVGFDDDTGSVRRYRLDLEDAEDSQGVEKVTVQPARKGWPWVRKAT